MCLIEEPNGVIAMLSVGARERERTRVAEKERHNVILLICEV